LLALALDLAPISHVFQLGQACLGAQQQRLRKQSSQRHQMPLAKLGQRGVIRMLIACQIAEGDVFIGARLDPARTVDVVGIPIQQ
jgi:hypothetical protein